MQSVAVTGHLYVVVDFNGAALAQKLMPKQLRIIRQEGERRKGKAEEKEKRKRRMRRIVAGGEGNIKERWQRGLPGCRQMLEMEEN